MSATVPIKILDLNNQSSALSKENQEVELAFRAFKQSYDTPDIKTAYLYRVEDREKLMDAELKKINQFLETDTKHLEELIKILKSRGITSFENKELVTSLLKKMDIDNSSSKKEILNAFMTVIKKETLEIDDVDGILGYINYERATESAENLLFNSDYPSESGAWYEPIDGNHSWANNASWMLGHFMKGTNKFIIKMNKFHEDNVLDMFSENKMYRKKTSTCKGQFGSGYIREIYCCILNGYILKKEGDDIILSFENPVFSSTNLPKVNFNPVPSAALDMFKLYTQIMKDYFQLFKPSLMNDLNGVIKFSADSPTLYEKILTYLFPELPTSIQEGSMISSSTPKVSDTFVQKLFEKIRLEAEKNEAPPPRSGGAPALY